MLDEEDINFVLLDLRLFEFDGWGILEKVKRNPETSVIPVSICTFSLGQPQEERAFDVDVAGYLIKPLSANVLRNAVSLISSIEDRTSDPQNFPWSIW